MRDKTPPICLVTGQSGTGKTALVEKLLSDLTSRGYKVATAKGHKHPIGLDQPGKDTWRHRRAGAVATFLITEDETYAFIDKNEAPDPEAVAKLCPEGVDLLLVEGFKTHEGRPKVLFSSAIPEPGNPEILCVVSDSLTFAGEYPLFKRNDAVAIASLIVEKVLGQ